MNQPSFYKNVENLPQINKGEPKVVTLGLGFQLAFQPILPKNIFKTPTQH
jgi:hypothetical protein